MTSIAAPQNARPPPAEAGRVAIWPSRPAPPLALAALLLAVVAAAVFRPASGQAQAFTRTPGTVPAATESAPHGEAAAELGHIEGLYREADAYRAETEILRFLHFRPEHPQRPAVELARAKLYYREGRYREADLMLFSLLDRHSGGAAAHSARQLLTFSQVRQGRYEAAWETLPALSRRGSPPPSLAEFASPPPGAVDAEAARNWSTWLPGSGYYLLDRPGKATTALALNATLLSAVALFAREGNEGAALLFLLFEAMLYSGGRDGVRQDAEAHNRGLRERQAGQWAARHGEEPLLRVGIGTRFGGG